DERVHEVRVDVVVAADLLDGHPRNDPEPVRRAAHPVRGLRGPHVDLTFAVQAAPGSPRTTVQRAGDPNASTRTCSSRSRWEDERVPDNPRQPIITDGLPSQLPDTDPAETAEWLESLDAVVNEAGRTRARYLLLRLLARARQQAIGVPSLTSTDYI